MPNQPLRLGIVGTGVGAARHVMALAAQTEVEVVAVSAQRAEEARSFALRHGIPLSFGDVRQMFRDAELDATCITGAVAGHHGAAIAAAEHRLHIVCDTPMARSGAEARDMYRMARDAGVRHAVSYSGRYAPAWYHFKQLIDRGYLGDLQSLSVTVYRGPVARPGRDNRAPADLEENAGALLGLGSGYLDALKWWFGEIHGVAGARAPLPARTGLDEDSHHAGIVVQFANGAIGTVHLCSSSPANLGDEIVAVGMHGMLGLQTDGRLFIGHRHEGRIVEEPLPEPEEDLGNDPPMLRHTRSLLRDWVQTIVSGTGSVPTFEDGMWVHTVTDAVMRSQDLHRWIDLSGKKWPM